MTTLVPLFQSQATYSFETMAPSILGSKLVDAKCDGGDLSYDLVSSMGFNIGAQYRDIYPKLPEGTPDAPKIMRWYVFKMPNGTRVPICEQWVNKDTIVLRDFVNAALFYERISPETLTQITQILVGSGHGEFTLTTS